MPGVKKLNQKSSSNSKPPYIFGHSRQSIVPLVHSSRGFFHAIPLISRIHEGIVLSPLHRESLPEKVQGLLDAILKHLSRKILLVADAFYSNKKVILPFLEKGHHLLSRVRHHTTAYEPVQRKTPTVKGRPRVYGKKVVLSELWTEEDPFKEAEISV